MNGRLCIMMKEYTGKRRECAVGGLPQKEISPPIALLLSPFGSLLPPRPAETSREETPMPRVRGTHMNEKWRYLRYDGDDLRARSYFL